MFTYLYQRALDKEIKEGEDDQITKRDGQFGNMDKFKFVLQNEPDVEQNESWLVSNFDHLHTVSTTKEFMITQEENFEIESDIDSIQGNQDSYKIEFKSTQQVSLDNEYENFELRDKIVDYVHSKTLLVYTPYVIINKTNIPLLIGQEKDIEPLVVLPNSSEYHRVDEDV